MKVLIVATDIRSFLDLKNIVIELRENNIEYFFLYSQERTRQFPTLHLDKYAYDTNSQVSSNYFSPTLGINLPFIPDLLLITNENWEPEKTILTEFKQQGTIIACIENTSWTVGTIKSRLEMLSRLSFPTNCIDIFFESSKWSLETKKLCGWYDFKSIIVGNPRYDSLEVLPEDNKGILVFGTMEKEACKKVYEILTQLDKADQITYYRPHPGEDVSKLTFNNIKLVLDQAEVPQIAANTSTHLSNISISTHYSLLYDKRNIAIDDYIGRNDDLDLEFFRGNEYQFWAPIVKVSSWKDFVEKIGTDRVKALQQRYDKLKEETTQYREGMDITAVDCKKLNSKIFDEFGDKQASKRIVEYIKKL